MADELTRRLQLHQILQNLLPEGKKAYFQPPENVKMEYPCIVYSRDFVKTEYANNGPYKHKTRYQVTIIDSDPDSEIPRKVAELELSAFNRAYVSANLNHDVYNVYF